MRRSASARSSAATLKPRTWTRPPSQSCGRPSRSARCGVAHKPSSHTRAKIVNSSALSQHSSLPFRSLPAAGCVRRAKRLRVLRVQEGPAPIHRAPTAPVPAVANAPDGRYGRTRSSTQFSGRSRRSGRMPRWARPTTCTVFTPPASATCSPASTSSCAPMGLDQGGPGVADRPASHKLFSCYHWRDGG